MRTTTVSIDSRLVPELRECKGVPISILALIRTIDSGIPVSLSHADNQLYRTARMHMRGCDNCQRNYDLMDVEKEDQKLDDYLHNYFKGLLGSLAYIATMQNAGVLRTRHA